MAQKKSVDEFWKDLNARPAPRMAQNKGMQGISGLPGISTITRVAPQPKPALPTEPAIQDVAIGAGAADAARRSVFISPLARVDVYSLHTCAQLYSCSSKALPTKEAYGAAAGQPPPLTQSKQGSTQRTSTLTYQVRNMLCKLYKGAMQAVQSGGRA